MSNQVHDAAEHPYRFYCPFCSNGFEPEDVLFVDEDKNAPLVKESEYDPQRFKDFESRVLTFLAVETADGVIGMEPRPVYKYHRWKKPAEPKLPFQEPIDVTMSQNSPFPSDITVLRRNGMSPKQLTGDEPAPWAVADIDNTQKEEPVRPESMSAFLKSMMGDNSGKQQEAKDAVTFEDARMTLVNMACPYCHSVLPEGFGELETYRIAMLGGTRSGKTTYMVAAANLLKHQSGLPMGLISSCSISKESARYFDFLIKCMEYNRLAATVLDDNQVIRFVFPIVMNLEAVDDDGNARKFILIINDIPGEAMTDRTFMMSYPGLRLADAAIMLMDPMQFISAVTTKMGLAKDDLKLIHGDHDVDEEMVKNYLAANYTPLSFGETLSSVKKMVVDSKFDKLHDFVLVLNKLDLLYAGEHPIIDEKTAASLSHIHGIYNLGAIDDSPDPAKSQHDNGVDMELIRNIDRQVVYLLEQRLRFSSYRVTLRDIEAKTGESVTLCTSVRNWNAAQDNFCRLADESGKVEANTIIGFRLLEPMLYVLARLNLVRTKEHVDEVVEEEKTGFFAKLRRLFHR